jgi:hypothetical protein
MKNLILIILILAFTTNIYGQANIIQTQNFKYRTIKKGYTGDWAGSQTDTTANNGINYNALMSEYIFSKIFTSTFSIVPAFKDSINRTSKDIVVDSSKISVNDTSDFFITNKAITIDSIKVIGRGVAMSIVVSYRYGTGTTLAGTAIITSPGASTSITTGTVVTSLDNRYVPANNRIWFLFPTVTTKPKQAHIVFYYH